MRCEKRKFYPVLAKIRVNRRFLQRKTLKIICTTSFIRFWRRSGLNEFYCSYILHNCLCLASDVNAPLSGQRENSALHICLYVVHKPFWESINTIKIYQQSQSSCCNCYSSAVIWQNLVSAILKTIDFFVLNAFKARIATYA